MYLIHYDGIAMAWNKEHRGMAEEEITCDRCEVMNGF